MYQVILTSEQARDARLHLGLSQGRVSAATGVNRTYLSLFENGKYLLPDGDLQKLRDHYIDLGAPLDGPAAPANRLPDPIGDEDGQVKQHGIRIADGFVVPAELDDDLVEGILAEYADNADLIRRLCDYELRKNHTSQPFPFWEGELDEREVKKRTHEVLVLMARNYVLVEVLKGHHIDLEALITPSAPSMTTGDFVGAILGSKGALPPVA